MINKAILVGNLGRDPEIRSTTSGVAVANFSIATNRRWKDKEGNRQEQTEWHNIVCFGRQAEVAGEYLAKGRQVYIEGRLQTRSWEDQESGETRYRTEVVCENFQMLGQRPEAEAVAEAGADAAAEVAEPPEVAEAEELAPAPKKRTRRQPAKTRRKRAKKS